MNNSAAKVGEIFREAGTAFNKLSEMTMALQPMDDSPTGGKWNDEEVEMLRGCVNRFAIELNKISQHIKNRTMSHLRRILESGANQDVSTPRSALPLIPPELPTISYPAQQLSPNNYIQGFEENNNDNEDLLQYFNPSVVPPLPPARLLQTEISPEPLLEFGDMQLDQINLDEINLQAEPDLLTLLDFEEFSVPTPITIESDHATRQHFENINRTDYSLVDIGTLYAELPTNENYSDQATGAFNNNRDETTSNYISLVSKEPSSAHFSFRQAEETWNHVSSPAINEAITHIESEEQPHVSGILYPGHFSAYTGHISSNTGHISSNTGHISSNAGHISSNTGQMRSVLPPTGYNRNAEPPIGPYLGSNWHLY